jgi:hypothetical protein
VVALVVLAVLAAGCGSGARDDPADGGGATSTNSTIAAAPTSPPTDATATAPITTEPPRPPLTAAPGPYAVGTTTIQVPADATAPALDLHVWYPASAPSDVRATYQIIPGVEIGSKLASRDLLPADGRFPLVLYSHGSGAFAFIATFFTEFLASHGYVVVAPDHPGDTIIDAFVREQTGASLDPVAAVEKRVVDLRRVRDTIAGAGAVSGGSGLLAGHVDAGRLVLAGHSLGGAGVLEAAAALDADAVIAMDPSLAFVPQDLLTDIEVPVLVMTGSAWLNDPGPFDLGSSGPWYRLAIPTAPHSSFTDVCDYGPLVPTWLAAGAPTEVGPYVESLIETTCVPPAMAPARVRDLVDGYSLAFLRSTPGGDGTWTDVIDEHEPDATVEQHPT